MDGRQRLKERLAQPGPLLVGGAHDGLSAKLVERAGFDAVWASGFEISAAHCVPDANILTMADQLRAAAWMVRSTDLPVIADCDNGYGNAINVIHMVRDYESEGVAAVCIEDNVFPKRCSFYAGVRRELAPVEEHVGKVKAFLDTRKSDDFLVIARTEALIAGWGMAEALRRGRAYADAGADMVLIHSKSDEPDEVMDFARQWERDTPLVCVPTIYKTATASSLHEGGFRVVIYANHGLRAGIKASREALTRLVREQHCSAVDDLVVPLQDVYDLIGVPQMKDDERAYLPAGGIQAGAVILAAGASPELGELTRDRPKAMLDIKGKSILARQIEALNAAGVKDIAAVVGWKKEAVNLPNLRTYVADESQGEVASLLAAAPELTGRKLVLYGDLLFDGEMVERLLRSEGDVVLVVDRSSAEGRAQRDLVETRNGIAAGDRFLHGTRSDTLGRIGRDIEGANGEWIGLMMLSEKGTEALKRICSEAAKAGGKGAFHQAQGFAHAALTDLLQAMVDAGLTVDCIDTYKGWMEIDTFEDYRHAWGLVR